MTLKEIYDLLKTIRIPIDDPAPAVGPLLPVTYNSWHEDDEPPLPFLVYRQTGVNNFGADNRVYHTAIDVDVELYTREKLPDVEAAVEAAFDSVPIFWTKTETYLDSERCFEILYEIEV